MPSILSGRVTRILITTVLLGLVFWFFARTPQFSGSLPLATYGILIGPLVLVVLLGFALFETRSRIDELASSRKLQAALALLAALVCWIVSLQYFIILAPEPRCASRPNFDLLWLSLPGQKILHCMSGGRAFDANAPYYLEPQWFQAWAHFAFPLIASHFAYRIWLASDSGSGFNIGLFVRNRLALSAPPTKEEALREVEAMRRDAGVDESSLNASSRTAETRGAFSEALWPIPSRSEIEQRSLLREIAGPLGPWLVAIAVGHGLLVVALASGLYRPSSAAPEGAGITTDPATSKNPSGDGGRPSAFPGDRLVPSGEKGRFNPAGKPFGSEPRLPTPAAP